MTSLRKTRAASVLGRLPRERQEEIAAHAREHSLADTVSWLRQDGIATSKTALGNWLQAWAMSEVFRICASDAENFMAHIKTRRPELPESEVEAMGNDFFQLQAIKTQNPDLFLAFRQARTKAEIERAKIALAERRVALLEAKAAQADKAKVVAESNLTPEEKLRQMKQIFGMPS
jgi:hypothetical protein